MPAVHIFVENRIMSAILCLFEDDYIILAWPLLLLVDSLIPESRLIYWSLPGVMGHLQVVTLPEWYFIAPDNQTFDLYITPSTLCCVEFYFYQVGLN